MEAQISAFLASLQTDQAYAQSTRLAYASDLRVFLDYLRASLNRSPLVDDLTARQVADFLEAENQAGRRLSTLVRRRATLRRFSSYLYQAGVLSGNVLNSDASLIDDTISSVSSERTAQCLTTTQIQQLEALIQTSPRPRARRDQAILTLLLETGLSVGTLISLNLSDLDLRAGKLHVTTETGEDTWQPLGNATASLERYINEGRPDLSHEPNEPALFISQMDGRMSRQGIWQILRYWGRLITPPVVLSPRLVRHTAALHMARKGRPLSEIQALLGHGNPLSTQALLRRLLASCGDIY
ncbi:MAG TPA: tyrosine-type recombinase/integrase [Anaerolineales bacterium]